MTIYSLYVKTHKFTGLKYLGYTKSKDPHKYKGSGVYWNRHLVKHGNYVTTVILHETTSKEEIENLGLYYSQLWDVVSSNGWANLILETGKGGFTDACREKSHGDEVNHKRNLTRVKNGHKYNTPETIAKQLVTRTQNGTLVTVTPESLAKRSATKRINGTSNNNLVKYECDHCGKMVGKPNYSKYHGPKCKMRKP